MALLRLIYRKRKIIWMILCMSLFWVVYLYLSIPSAADMRKRHREHVDKQMKAHRETLTNAAQVIRNGGKVESSLDSVHSNLGQSAKESDKSDKVINMPVKPAGPLQPPINIHIHIDSDGAVKNISRTKTLAGAANSNHSKVTLSTAPKAHVGKVDKMLQLGAQVKNKTLQKLSDLGIIAKPKPVIKHIAKTSILNITMSEEEFLFVIKTLIKESETKNQKLAINRIPKKNSSALSLHGLSKSDNNSTVSSRVPRDLCDCTYYDCVCCAQLQLTKLHVSRKACTNFTFMPKSQEVFFKFLLDGKMQFNETISAEQPPRICLGSLSKVVDICVDFLNMTFKVNMHQDHKTQLNGCVDFAFNVYNRTISSFPLGCFQIPGKAHTEEDHQLPLLGNWVP